MPQISIAISWLWKFERMPIKAPKHVFNPENRTRWNLIHGGRIITISQVERISSEKKFHAGIHDWTPEFEIICLIKISNKLGSSDSCHKNLQPIQIQDIWPVSQQICNKEIFKISDSCTIELCNKLKFRMSDPVTHYKSDVSKVPRVISPTCHKSDVTLYNWLVQFKLFSQFKLFYQFKFKTVFEKKTVFSV